MVSVLLATTGRPEMAVACLASILGTKGDHEVEFVVSIDNDLITQRRIKALSVRDLKVSYSEGYRGCSKAWQDAYEASSGDLLVLAADDLLFREGWLDAALEEMKQLPEGGGLVGFNDTQTDGNEYATHYLATRWFIENHMGGKIAWEDYRHSFNDVEASERAKRAGRFIFAPEAVVEHRHWLWGTRPKDETDTRFLGDHAASQTRYHEREAQGFPD